VRSEKTGPGAAGNLDEDLSRRARNYFEGLGNDFEGLENHFAGPGNHFEGLENGFTGLGNHLEGHRNDIAGL
jgi:hypothetical protein